MENIIPPTVEEGDKNVTERITPVIDDLLRKAIYQSEVNESDRLERLKKVKIRRKNCLEKLKRLEKAKEQKEKQLAYLERWWSTLENGVPEMVTYLDPHPSPKGWKRKRKADKSEMRKLEREKEGKVLATDVLEGILQQVEVEHDCGVSVACPAWLCCMLVKKRKLETELLVITEMMRTITCEDMGNKGTLDRGVPMDNGVATEHCLNHLVHKVTDLSIDTCTATYAYDEVCQAQEVQTRADIPTIVVDTDVQCGEQCQAQPKIETSPVKYLIDQFEHPELGLVGNKPSTDYLQYNIQTIPNRLSPVKDLVAKFEDANGLSSGAEIISCEAKAKPMVEKRKIWTKLKSGLFGWRKSKLPSLGNTTSAKFIPSTSKPNHSVKTSANRANILYFQANQPLTADGGKGGGGSEIVLPKITQQNFYLTNNRNVGKSVPEFGRSTN